MCLYTLHTTYFPVWRTFCIRCSGLVEVNDIRSDNTYHHPIYDLRRSTHHRNELVILSNELSTDLYCGFVQYKAIISRSDYTKLKYALLYSREKYSTYYYKTL